jgi:hypothetical protein
MADRLASSSGSQELKASATVLRTLKRAKPQNACKAESS